MKANRVLPTPPKLAPHVAKLLSWRGPVADDDVPDAERFGGLRPRTTPAGSSSPRAYPEGWIAGNLAHPELRPDGHNQHGHTR